MVIGAGPGGYVAAIRAAQLNKRTAVVEKERIGGTCMNWGCIPTKYLLHQTKIFVQAKENPNCEGPKGELQCNWSRVQSGKKDVVQRLVKGIEYLLQRQGVDIIRGEAVLKNDHRVAVHDGRSEELYDVQKIILATGSSSKDLPFLSFKGNEIIDSRSALELEDIPDDMVIVGAGAIGLEMGTIFRRLGCRVRVLEIMPSILPGSDVSVARRLERILKSQGLEIATRMRIEGAQIHDGRISLNGTCLKDNSPFEFKTRRVLLAAGRRPNTDVLKQGDVDPGLDDAGFVRVDGHLETGIPGIYAIGDLTGGKLLAHKASHEGILAVENAAGSKRKMEYHALPMSVFTEPEFASVGLTEREARDIHGDRVKTGQFSLQANGRALTLGEFEGAVKVVADSKERIVGAHMIAPHASELIAEITLAIKKGLCLKDVAATIHIHPTLSEAIMESALHARNEAIHVMNR